MWELAIPVTIGVIVVLVIGLLLAKLYRRSTRDEAYVRTGLGGQTYHWLVSTGLAPINASLAYAILNVLVCYLAAWALWRRNWFLKF